MPIARSPVASPSGVRTNPPRAARSKYHKTHLEEPPAAATPTPHLAQEPPATPIGSFQAPLQATQHRASSLSGPDSNSSSDEEIGDSTLLMARERPRGRSPHYSSDPALVKLLQLLTTHITGSSTSSPTSSSNFKTPGMKAPDCFDGTPTLLRHFLQQCQLIFHNDARTFSNDRKKVLYAVSFLSGKAGKWIEPYLSLLGNEDPTYILNSWSLFESQLFTLFGDPNETRKAEQDLDSLHMRDSGQVSSYITDFRTLTTKIPDWGEKALMYHFRKGLPSRLLDQLAVHQGPLDSLQDLMKTVLDYDIRYHERQKEKTSTSHHSSSSKPSNRQAPPSFNTRPQRNWNSKPRKDSNNFQPSRLQHQSFSHLHKDGTLKHAERERRIKAGLCTYCGGKHKLDDCPLLKAKRSKLGSSSNFPSKNS